MEMEKKKEDLITVESLPFKITVSHWFHCRDLITDSPNKGKISGGFPILISYYTFYVRFLRNKEKLCYANFMKYAPDKIEKICERYKEHSQMLWEMRVKGEIDKKKYRIAQDAIDSPFLNIYYIAAHIPDFPPKKLELIKKTITERWIAPFSQRMRKVVSLYQNYIPNLEGEAISLAGEVITKLLRRITEGKFFLEERKLITTRG
ncbi:MAG: hypothetical protein J7L39_01805, partial [Candidatus Aenigmarchaeota archaeon]|nr:hypothetical protein [Candidatus Aenigmarchaeota archaeon]